MIVLLCKVRFECLITTVPLTLHFAEPAGQEVRFELRCWGDVRSGSIVCRTDSSVHRGAAPIAHRPRLRSVLNVVLFQSCHLLVLYVIGMTETATTLTFPRLDQKIGTLGSGGQLLPGDIARVLKPDGTFAGYNEPGELVVKGPSITLCYLNNPQAYVPIIVLMHNHDGLLTPITCPELRRLSYTTTASRTDGSKPVTR